jgi:hypothetical protein
MLMAIGFGIGAGEAALLVDRGLPTANLNDAAGTNRSNMSWGGELPWITGDTFSIGTAGQTYTLDVLRVWVVGEPPAPTSLLGGPTGTGAISQISATILSDTVVPGYQYQGQSGMFDVHQVDFKVNWTIYGGKGYYFFVNGSDEFFSPFLHASNAGLSGSTQDGSDNLFWNYNTLTGDLLSADSAFDLWDKSTDINVQVFGKLPEPGSILLIGFGLAGLAVSRKMFRA